jgi:hypothetical protein
MKLRCSFIGGFYEAAEGPMLAMPECLHWLTSIWLLMSDHLISLIGALCNPATFLCQPDPKGREWHAI